MLPSTIKTGLIRRTQAVFDQVCQSQLGDMKHAPVIETDFTASFVKYGVPELHKEFASTLGRSNIKVVTQAVYIHQSPMVEIDDPRPPHRVMSTSKCELGDILFVQSHRRNPRKTYWRAVLWQLKKDSGSPQKATDPQLWLYEQWPAFHVYRGGLEADRRNFWRDKHCDQRSGRFALVSNQSWKICPPVSPIGPASPGVVDAGQFLIEMMYAVDPQQPARDPSYGRRVFTRPEPERPLTWSQTIWDILNYTGARDFSARNLFRDRQSRLSLMHFSQAGNTFSIAPPPVRELPEGEEERRGLYLIHIAVDASEFEPETDRRPD